MAVRSARIDALRGFALFGILLVNVWSFVYGVGLYRYAPHEPLGALDQWALLFVAAVAEQKFYPIFAFLFGAGFALQTGARRFPGPRLDSIKAAYNRRATWLLCCGLVHGALVWFGDILTAYAATAFWLATKAGRRLSDLAASLRLLVMVNAAIFLLLGALTAASHGASIGSVNEQVHDAIRAHVLYTQGGWTDAALQRLTDFGANVFEFVIFLPRLALLFLLGVFAVRLGWLTRPHRHRALWRRVLAAGLAVGVPANAWWGMTALADAADPYHPLAFAGIAQALLDVAGPCLAAAFVAAFMLARDGFCNWLVPVGRMALTNYLTQSVVLSLLLQGYGLGLGAWLSPAQLLGLCSAIMAGQLLVSRWWLARNAQGPMETIWRQYTFRVESL